MPPTWFNCKSGKFPTGVQFEEHAFYLGNMYYPRRFIFGQKWFLDEHVEAY